MPEPLLQKVDCVMLSVPNLDEGIAFYRDRLGHRLVWRSATAAGLKLPQSEAEIVLQTERKGLEVDFLVASADAAAAEFEKAGGEVLVPPFEIQIGRCVVVSDPWGNPLVLLDMSKGRLVTDEAGNIIGNEQPGG